MIGRFFFRHLVMPAYESVYQRRQTFSYWRSLEESQWWDEERLRDHQFHALRRLLAHAKEHCPHYHQQWVRLGLSGHQIDSIDCFSKWPLLDKPEIRANRNSMRAMKYHGPLISKSTGGSSGEPLHFDLDQISHDRRNAATFRGYQWAGAGPGAKQFYLWGVPLGDRSPRQVWKDRLYNAIQRRRVVSSFGLAAETVGDILGELNRYRPDSIVAYTGAIYQFARMLAERNLRPFSPQSIVVGAEKLHDFQRELIESTFGAPVFETYGSREFMLIGAECPEHHGLHLTSEQLLVEVVDDDGQPTPDGEVGNVVVTDLYNYGMPFIRYVTGDRARAGFKKCSCGRGLPLLREVVGRRTEAIRTPDGRNVSGLFFPHLMKDFADIRQFQVVQTALDRLELRVVLASTWRAADRDRLLRQVRETLGPQVAIEWRPVPHIELTAAGKQRVVVSQLAV